MATEQEIDERRCSAPPWSVCLVTTFKELSRLNSSALLLDKTVRTTLSTDQGLDKDDRYPVTCNILGSTMADPVQPTIPTNQGRAQS